jgi:site-specific DNA recombinase
MYRCSGSLGHIGRQAEPVDSFVSAVIVGRLARPDAADLLVDHTRPDVPALRQEATALRSRLDALAVDFADGDLTASQLRTATERLRARLSVVESSLADAGRVSVLGPLVGASDVEAAWGAMDTDRRRAVIDALAVVTLLPPGRGTRTFRPETVGIDWRTS